jgi:hypothetical protein
MTDPLRPFADMIRSLWLVRARATAPARVTVTSRPDADVPTSRSLRTLRSRLQARMSASQPAGAARMREAFVETVLLWELGEELASDPRFVEMVTSVAEQVASDPSVGERLNRMLTRLASETR